MPTQEEEEKQMQQQRDSDSDYRDSDQKEEEVQNEKPPEPDASDATADDDDYGPLSFVRPGEEMPTIDNTPETNIRRLTKILESKTVKAKREAEYLKVRLIEEEYDFPVDPENWTEEDLKELWADGPLEISAPGWDPAFAEEEDWEFVNEEIEAGREPPIAPFYLPYRKPYPAIPKGFPEIPSAKGVVEELERTEEFLTWVSYIFADGSSYEGTIWDDLAHGKGVYIAEQGLVRYEGEWLQNDMEGHGVVEVDIPDVEPVPGSELEAKMRAEGKIISRDFMSPEDREWLEMDIEDSIRLAGGEYEIPFYENDEWIKQFGRKPEKGRYRYAGQWKHGRMHGCGLYEVNERPIYGRFYFGELVGDSEGCDEETCALHAGLAEVAAAKARMFVLKPDGMVREERGPYGDPQHPYFYEEEDVWMAPGFINQFYEVPDYWKTYVHEIDQEREMWLNSFYKSPFRIPMPAELEYWWQKDQPPEFVLVNKEPEPDPEDPSKLIYTEDPLILHTPTGRLINYIEDEKYGVRLFWQPPLKEGEDVDPEKIEFLPLGFDEFYGRQVGEEKKTIWKRLVMAFGKVLKPVFNKLENWCEEQKKASEIKMDLYEKELDLIEAELCLEEAIEDMDEELKRREKEEGEEKEIEIGLEEEEDTSVLPRQAEKDIAELEKLKDEMKKEDVKDEVEKVEEEGEEEEEEEEDDNMPSSFGSVTADQNPTKDEQNGKKPGESPFSSSSLSFASCSLVSLVPSRLQKSFLLWKQSRLPLIRATPCIEDSGGDLLTVDKVSFPSAESQRGSLRAVIQACHRSQTKTQSSIRGSHLHSPSRSRSCPSDSAISKRVLKPVRAYSRGWLHSAPDCDLDNILSLHTPMCYLESNTDTKGFEPHCMLSKIML